MNLPSGGMRHMSINNREKLPKSCWRAREDSLEINTCHSQSIKQVSCMGKCCLMRRPRAVKTIRAKIQTPRMWKTRIWFGYLTQWQLHIPSLCSFKGEICETHKHPRLPRTPDWSSYLSIYTCISGCLGCCGNNHWPFVALPKEQRECKMNHGRR